MSSKDLTFKASGMHCAACESFIETRLKKAKGVKKVEANLDNNEVRINADSRVDQQVLLGELNKLVKDNGYSLHLNKKRRNWGLYLRDLSIAFAISLGLVLLYLLFESFGFLPNVGVGFDLNPLTAFSLGIVASLSTCSAVLGGIILSLSANTAKIDAKASIFAGIGFHISRILSFFVFGGVLGYLGMNIAQLESFNRLEFDFWMNLALGIIMLILGLNLLDLFKLNFLTLKMPKIFGTKILEAGDQKSGIISGVLLGFLSFFFPCNFTQALQFSAFGTGDVLQGAIILFAFSLGTLPVLATITFFSINFSKSINSSIFFKVSGIIIIALSTFTIYSSLILRGIIPYLG
jgi:sulfite exporter TauE/SafE/copper chaperone CopZ